VIARVENRGGLLRAGCGDADGDRPVGHRWSPVRLTRARRSPLPPPAILRPAHPGGVAELRLRVRIRSQGQDAVTFRTTLFEEPTHEKRTLSTPASPSSPEDSTAGSLTNGRLLARNAVGNLASQCGPMLVAVLSVPMLIGGLGTDRFGVLTLAWMLLGYFSLFDLGLGRALTKLVAEKLGLGQERQVPGLVGTALVLMTVLGLLGTLLIAVLVPWLVHSALKVPAEMRPEAICAFYLMAVALPFLIGTAGLRGVMEAYQRVGPANVVRTVVGLYSLIAPVLVLPFSRNLVVVVGVVVAGRIGSWAAHLAICLRTIPGMRSGFTVQGALLWPLLGYGGWMTLANIINPIMLQMDRFFIGGLISTAAVA